VSASAFRPTVTRRNRCVFACLSLASIVSANLAGCVGTPEDEAEFRRQESIDTISQGLTVGSCNVDVQPLRSIEIVHPNVVDDARSNNATGGVWSFRTLIERMAPAGQTDAFLRGIFESWESNQVVNGETLFARPAVAPVIMNTFQVPGSSPRRFNLANAPFKLIAIANRVDLRDSTTGGEGRFVFALTSGPNGSGFPLSMSVILEFKLPLTGTFNTAEKWAAAWHELDAIDPATNPAAFNAKLQTITDAFSAAGAFPGKPNNSAISQIRTNEIALNGPWQLREFTMNASGFMVPATTKNSPNQNLNGSQRLVDFINTDARFNATNDTSFLNINMPEDFNGDFLGGKADQGAGNWVLPNNENQFSSVRADNFGLLTCNGCHNENKPSGDRSFYHVDPTSSPGPDGTGRLSLFMTQGEPSKGGRRPAELTRRAQDMGTLLCSNSNPNIKRTVIFMFGQTVVGQDMFLRGGIDHTASQNLRGITCTSSNFLCAIPITHNNLRNGTTNPWKAGDSFLDWYGRELFQTQTSPGHGLAEGTPADWTTNNSSNPNTVANQGFGFTPLNRFGDHFWMLDVNMDCSKAFNGVWFEVKSFISNGPGWESDVNQPGRPYASGNHFAQCGKINKFSRGSSAAEITDF